MPSDKGEIVLGVDLDGVCADFYARMREIAAEWPEVGLDTLSTDVSYGLTEWGIRDDDHYRQLHRFAVTPRDFFETCPPIRGAGPTLRRLSDEGYRVRIIKHPVLLPSPDRGGAGGGVPRFAFVQGSERKTTGSYYTARELVKETLDSAPETSATRHAVAGATPLERS